MNRIILLLSMLVYVTIALAQRTTPINGVSASAEKRVNTLFAKGKVPPFSFMMDGIHSSEFIRSWHRTIEKVASDDSNILQYNVVYTSPDSNVSVICDVLLCRF